MNTSTTKMPTKTNLSTQTIRATVVGLIDKWRPAEAAPTGESELGLKFSEIGVDSLDIVELIMDVEDEFDLFIADPDAEKCTTPQKLIDLLCQKLNVTV